MRAKTTKRRRGQAHRASGPSASGHGQTREVTVTPQFASKQNEASHTNQTIYPFLLQYIGEPFAANDEQAISRCRPRVLCSGGKQQGMPPDTPPRAIATKVIESTNNRLREGQLRAWQLQLGRCLPTGGQRQQQQRWPGSMDADPLHMLSWNG